MAAAHVSTNTFYEFFADKTDWLIALARGLDTYLPGAPHTVLSTA